MKKIRRAPQRKINASFATYPHSWDYVSDKLEKLITDLGGDPQVITQYSRWPEVVDSILYMLDTYMKGYSKKPNYGVYSAYADSIDVGDYICDSKDGEFVKVIDIFEGPYGIIFKLEDGSKQVYQEGDEVFVDESRYEG